MVQLIDPTLQKTGLPSNLLSSMLLLSDGTLLDHFIVVRNPSVTIVFLM